MNPFLSASGTCMELLFADVLLQMDGIPERDLNHWRPRDGMSDVNTFYALAMHTFGAAEFWVVEAAGGVEVHRNRPGEFVATGSIEELRERSAAVLTEIRGILAALDDVDLGEIYERIGNPEAGLRPVRWSKAECVVHSVEHTAVHVGHLQLQRQLWDAEHAA